MIEKRISTRIIHKHDIEANWNKATTFIPKKGELIIYDNIDKDDNVVYDRVRIKYGDGVHNVIELPFTESIPSYSNAAEGSILRIVNGVPTWVLLPNAEEATF